MDGGKRSKLNEVDLDDFRRDAIDRTDRKNYIANQHRIFSITFGMFLCLTGVVLTTIEPFKACMKYLFQKFFTKKSHFLTT
jgi:hypothetical protein